MCLRANGDSVGPANPPERERVPTQRAAMFFLTKCTIWPMGLIPDEHRPFCRQGSLYRSFIAIHLTIRLAKNHPRGLLERVIG